MRVPPRISSIIIHLIVWIGYSLLLFYGPSVMMERKVALLFSGRTIIMHIILFYLNSYYLLPRLLGKSKYTSYVLSVGVVLVVSSILFYITDDYIGLKGPDDRDHQVEFSRDRNLMSKELSNLNDSLVWEQDYNEWQKRQKPEFEQGDSLAMRERRKPPFSKEILGVPIPPGIRMGTLSSIGILFISILFWVIGESRKQHENEMTLMNQNLKNEMKFLKSQINPHFLFNALNNIYSLSILNSVKTPDMIVKLSEMLRYVLYDSEGKKVPLSKELAYIRNFIEFQRVKIEGIPNLHVDIDRADGQLMIEPMLLIPFIENAFKYSKLEDTEKGWLKMVLTTEKGLLRFEIRNSLLGKNVNGEPGGIGVENTRQRLKMLYPEKHELYVGQTESEFRVLLKIDLNEA
ncbi:sensor histidine kinase [Carboxylicivirga caseinilyticus]|uniref:sensor histidine kinase n=1 Tax=Carboxylicivirga caseinilyticus TaxID=3417572 RepID=UPI003D357163|nr:histidine kinase [Marinilabiliaceae bacterium A049]